MIAQKDIGADIPVASIPRHLFITLSDSIRTHPELSKVFSDVSVWTVVSQLPDAILAIRLLYEKLTSKEKSPWYPWIKVLPETYTTTLYWKDSDLSLLKDGNEYHMTNMHRTQITDEYRLVIRQTLSKRFPTIFKTNIYTESEYKWALSTVWSRATEFELDGGHQKIIIPFMDMFNHSFGQEVAHLPPSAFGSLPCTRKYNAATKTYDIISTSAINMGSQVFLNYGRLGNAKLLHVYGFTVPDNPYDYLQMFFKMGEEAEFYQEKKALLAAAGLEPSPSLYLKLEDLSSDIPIEILGTVRIQRISDPADLANASVHAFDPKSRISEENEVYALKSLEEGLRQLFLSYAIPYDADIQVTEAINEKKIELSFNELNALNLRLGDRKIIGKAGGFIVDRLEAIRAHLREKIASGDTTPLVPTE